MRDVTPRQDILRPCPFCGARADTIYREGWYSIQCSRWHYGCPVNMRTHYHDTPEQAAVAWNTRWTGLAEEYPTSVSSDERPAVLLPVGNEVLVHYGPAWDYNDESAQAPQALAPISPRWPA